MYPLPPAPCRLPAQCVRQPQADCRQENRLPAPPCHLCAACASPGNASGGQGRTHRLHRHGKTCPLSLSTRFRCFHFPVWLSIPVPSYGFFFYQLAIHYFTVHGALHTGACGILFFQYNFFQMPGDVDHFPPLRSDAATKQQFFP